MGIKARLCLCQPRIQKAIGASCQSSTSGFQSTISVCILSTFHFPQPPQPSNPRRPLPPTHNESNTPCRRNPPFRYPRPRRRERRNAGTQPLHPRGYVSARCRDPLYLFRRHERRQRRSGPPVGLQWAIAGGYGALSVCNILNNNHQNLNLSCRDWAGVVAVLVWGSINAAALKNLGPEGTTGGPGRRRRRRRASHPDHARLLAPFAAQGFEWDSIGTLASSERRDVPISPDVLDSIVLHGFRQADNGGAVPQVDVSLVTFADGTGTTTVKATESPVAGSGSVLEKRHDDAGSKVNWRINEHNYWALAADEGIDPIRQVMLDAAGSIAQDFVWQADNRDLDEWIGWVRVNNDVTQVMSIALRIMERSGFGSNYEDVGVCGPVF